MAAIVRDPELADKIIQFINQLPIVDGDAVGQKFKVDPWQEQFIRSIYEPHYADRRTRRAIRKAYLSCARKNAKSYLIAGLLLAHLIGPAAVPNGQLFTAALDRAQAKVIFNMVAKMIAMVPFLRERLQIRQHQNEIRVADPSLRSAGSVYTALSADVASKHGLGADFFCYDEMGEARDDELWNVLFDSQQARSNPIAIAISTQSHDPNRPFMKALDAGPDENTVVQIHAADEGCDLLDEAQWLKANPSLATWKNPDSIRVAAIEAVNNPSKEANFRLRYLNQRVAANSQFFNAHHLKQIDATTPAKADEAEQLTAGEEIYIGVDISKRTDLTAIVAVSCSTGLVKSWFLKPAGLVSEHTRKDKVTYDEWAEAGWLTTPNGETIAGRDIAYIIEDLVQTYSVKALVYDFNHSDDVIRELRERGYTVGKEPENDIRGIRWGNAANDAAKAVNAIEQAVLNRTIKLDGNPILRMCLANAVIKADLLDRRMFVKGKATQRIDGAIALSIALACQQADSFEKPIAVDWSAMDFRSLVI